jgi:hypothetical protein
MEEIAHRIDEDHSRPLPRQRLFKAFWPQSEVKTRLKQMTRYVTETLRKSLSVAVVTAGADFRAPRYRVPSRIRPFDCRLVSHVGSLTGTN